MTNYNFMNLAKAQQIKRVTNEWRYNYEIYLIAIKNFLKYNLVFGAVNRCGSDGEIFSKEKGIYYLSQYSQEELPILIKEIYPDLALLLSVWPETFSYTLSELFIMRIPVLAINTGSFQDRIIDDVNGFLVESSSDKILEKVKSLFAKYPFSELYRIKNSLRDIPHRGIGEMIDDYYQPVRKENLTSLTLFSNTPKFWEIYF